MTKKILFLLAMATALCSYAQNAVGDWFIHTSFVGSEVTTVADTHNWVYYMSGSNLFRLDKETQENEALSKINDLSDMGISQIYYNHNRDYVVVIYTDANIDIIQSDGAVVNMSEVMDAVMTYSKAINDVTFADGLIYLATDFGYVVINDSKFVVKESHIYGTEMNSVAQVGQMLLLSTDDGVYYGSASEYHEQMTSFTKSSTFNDGGLLRPIGNDRFFYINDSTNVVTMTDSQDGSASFSSTKLFGNEATVVQKTTGGYLLNVPSLGKFFKTDENGLNPVATDCSGEIVSSNTESGNTIWAVGSKGVHELGSESYYLPNALSFAKPFWMTYNKDKDMLYVSSTATNSFFTTSDATAINTYDGMSWTDVTPKDMPKGGSYWLEFLPGDPDTYFLGGWTSGLHKIVNNELAYTYNASNSPLMKKSGAMHPISRFDRNGNLWVIQSFENPDHPAMVLPAAKTKLDQVTANDWTTPTINSLNTGHTKRASFLATKTNSNDIKVFADGDYKMPLVFWYSNNEITGQPAQVSYTTLSDQDGSPYTWTYIMCLTEDLKGTVWMGSTEGVISFNPAGPFANANFTINHIKVPRNDGTGMADYLMDGIQVNSIAVDGANRKWLGTQTSGLFLVSADGTEIIKKFNTTNSPLASNTIYQVCCNPNSNSVYVTTPAGLYEYFSDSSPAYSDYNNIYAYPNPVRPEYTGLVTITGMMDNSLVKIADASGNVIKQLKSTGGMTTWDCCDQNGDHVKTGVYFVICSQANGGGEGVVTKIAIIN